MSCNTIELEEEIRTEPDQQENIWGKLISLNRSLTDDFNLTNEEVTIGRSSTCNIQINGCQRISREHCKLIYTSENKLNILDLSPNGTFVNDKCIGKGKTMEDIKSGDIIYLLNIQKTPKDQQIGYIIHIIEQQNTQKPQLKRQGTLDLNEPQQQQEKKEIQSLPDSYKCGLCNNFVYQCVSLNPCKHNFCGGCISQRIQQKDYQCPSCNVKMEALGKNKEINQKVKQYLEENTHLQRSSNEYIQLNIKNKITADYFKISFLENQNNQNEDNLSNYSYKSEDNKANIKIKPKDCPECVIQRNDGFKCIKDQQHYDCTSCKRKFPQRDNCDNQNCFICKRPFCGLYLQKCDGWNPSILYFKDQNIPKDIRADVFKGNDVELKILKKQMTDNKITSKDIFDIMFVKKGSFSYQISKKLSNYTGNQKELKLYPETPLCTECFPQIWHQMIFRYLENIKKTDNIQKQDCYWGINCRTMLTNKDHAEKFNHICEQQRF